MSEDDKSTPLEVEEYKACRDLISKNIDIIEKSEIYAVGAAAASAAFALSNPIPLVRETAAYLPAFIAIFGFVRYLGIDKTMHIIHDYIETIEVKYPKIGWVGFYRIKNTERWLKGSRYGIWSLLFLLGILFIHVIYLQGFSCVRCFAVK